MTARIIVALLVAGCAEDGEPGPAWLSAPDEVATGGWLWGVTDRLPDEVDVSIDRQPLALDRHILFGGMWRIPPLPVGSAKLELASPGRGPSAQQPLQLRTPAFVDVASAVGLQFEHRVEDWPEACAESVTAVAVADLDGDGALDVFVGNATGDSVAWLAQGGGDGVLPTFVDATQALGLDGLQAVSAASFADMDSDGDADLLVGRRGADVLLENRRIPDGDTRFVDVSDRLPAGEERRTMGAAWGDLDGDADLDLYLVAHHWCFPDPTLGEPRSGDRLLRNDGDTFVDLSGSLDDSTGAVSDRLGFSAVWLDLDADGDQDLVVANDVVGRRAGNVVWLNRGPGALPPLQLASGIGLDLERDALGKGPNAMGLDVGDVDGDGRLDVITSNIGPNLLFLGQPDGTWVEAGGPAGLQRTVLPWGQQQVTWATHLLDRDLDGDLDAWVVGGALKGERPQPHGLFDGLGDGTFVDRTWTSGAASPLHGKASAVLDLDGDGYLDVLVANWGGALEVWHNRTADQLDTPMHWLTVDLEGDGAQVARDAFGSVVSLQTPDGRVQTCWRNPRPSLSATGDPGCHFGLGAQTSISSITVTWPDGVTDDVGVPTEVDRRVRYAR